MTSIGVRELRQRASEYLRRVEGGETFEVTDRGRPVALLSPIPDDASSLVNMRLSGRLSAATEEGFPEPMDPESLTILPSEALRDLRSDER